MATEDREKRTLGRPSQARAGARALQAARRDPGRDSAEADSNSETDSDTDSEADSGHDAAPADALPTDARASVAWSCGRRRARGAPRR